MDASIALCALPLAVGILGTLAAMGIFGRKLPGDRSNEVAELHTLLARREQELERLEAAAEAAAGQSQALQAENTRLAEQLERLTTAHADAERRAADAEAQAAALRADLAAAQAARRDIAVELKRRDDDVAALNARLSEAIDELTAARAKRTSKGSAGATGSSA